MPEKKKTLFLFKMARLVSYKPKDENRYSTFRNESTVNPSYKESDLFKRVEIVKKTRKPKTKKSICSRCLTFWYNLCSCCCCSCCCRGGKKKCGYFCGYCQNYEGDNSNEDVIDIKTISCTSSDIHMSEINVNNFNSEKTKSKTSKKLSSRWNWNDSLRSNSDRFLETLEYDLDGDRSLKKKSNRTSSKIPLYCQGKGLW